MKQKVFYGIAAVAMIVCIILAGRAMVSAGKLKDEVADANAEILKLQTVQKDTSSNDVTELQKVADAQAEEIKSLQEDNKALLQLFAMEMGYSEEELEDMTLHEVLQELIEGGYFVSVHEIWDDTEVVNAYLTGDDSKIVDERDQFVLDCIREIIPQIITSEDMTDYEMEKAVYDWQVKYVNFAEESLAPIPDNDEDEDVSYLPYGVLKYREAICVGNATTFKLFMDCLGIPCMIIHSTEEGEHAWNLVQIDGDWYHVDITFDSMAGSEPMYTYFNVTDSVKEGMGYPWNPDDFPEANATKYNYAYMNAVDVADVTGIPQAIKDCMKKGSGMIYLKCPEENAYYAYTIVNTIAEHLDNGYMELTNIVYGDDGDGLVSIEYRLWDEDDPVEPEYPDPVDDEIYEKINEAMKDAFGYELSLEQKEDYYE